MELEHFEARRRTRRRRRTRTSSLLSREASRINLLAPYAASVANCATCSSWPFGRASHREIERDREIECLLGHTHTHLHTQTHVNVNVNIMSALKVVSRKPRRTSQQQVKRRELRVSRPKLNGSSEQTNSTACLLACFRSLLTTCVAGRLNILIRDRRADRRAEGREFLAGFRSEPEKAAQVTGS